MLLSNQVVGIRGSQSLLELGDEGPGLARNPALTLALILFRWIVATAVRAPAQGMPLRTPLVRGARVSATIDRWLRRILWRAAIHLDEVVAQPATLGDVEHCVVGTVRVEVRDGCVTSLATAELGSGIDRYATEDIGARAGKRVGHSATVAEASGENARGINAKIALDLLEDRVGEIDVSSIRISPAGVETLRSHEDRAAFGQIPKAIIRIVRGPAITSVSDLRCVPVEPMVGHDQTVRLGVVVVVRYAQDVFAVRAAALDGLATVHQRTRGAAARARRLPRTSS